MHESFGDVDWIPQAVSAITLAADVAIKQLSGSHVTSNASSEDGYLYPPRTREELLAKTDDVADERNVGANEGPLDPAENLEKQRENIQKKDKPQWLM